VLTDLTPEQRELAAYMSELSERAYSAGWMEGLEYALWRAATAGPFRYGYLDLAPEHTERLKALSDACGGWIRFDEHLEEVFIPVAQWAELYCEQQNG
jgi:hypothetical protein